MKRRLFIAFTLAVGAFAGGGACQHSAPRAPSSADPTPVPFPMAELTRLYELRNEEALLWDRLQLARKKMGYVEGSEAPPKLRPFRKDLTMEIQALRKAHAALAPKIAEGEKRIALALRPYDDTGTASARPQAALFETEKPWRTSVETFVLHKSEPYQTGPGRPVKVFAVSDQGAKKVELTLKNFVFSWRSGLGKFEKNPVANAADGDSRQFVAKLRCDSPVRVTSVWKGVDVPAGREHEFFWLDSHWNGQKVLLEFSSGFRGCTLRFRDKSYAEGHGPSYAVRFEPESKFAPALTRFDNRVEVCRLPKTDRLKGPEAFFMTSRYLSMTCPDVLPAIKTLEANEEALLAKAQALSGARLPESFIRKGDPFASIDMSRAPKLDLVVVSSLVFRHDFHGHVIARLLDWHARRGTQVRILVAGAITLGKDKEMIYDLQAGSSNIRAKFFEYSSQGLGFRDWLNTFHRVNHVKLFMTLSSEDPQANVFITGGRNIHDGFAFTSAPNLTSWPHLVHYGNKDSDESFAHWQDFEIEIRDKPFTEKMAAHFMTLWGMDGESQFMRSFSMNLPSPVSIGPEDFEGLGGSWVRHLVSVPYKDDMAMERFYVELFDSAEKEILLSTPYFRPTKRLEEALVRAVGRGVQVKLVTRLDLEGDTADIILSEVNKTGVNAFLNKIRIYEFTVPKVILHSKLILIDRKMTYVTSVNMNQRSFYHDLENGLIVYDAEFSSRILTILEDYFAKSKEITEKQKTVFWKQALIRLIEKEL